MNDIQGWINLYKPKNISSFQAINKLKKKFLFKKIGHAGTLDPLAEGILPVAIGKTTKLIPFISNNFKTYQFTITWGSQTSTDDSNGEVIFSSKKIPTLQDIKINLKKFEGHIEQIPPKYSAVKIKGERAYKLARKNHSFDILPKEVFVKNLNVVSYEKNKTSFLIETGKGFYIRSFARDFARVLKTFGHISSLERIKVGKFIKKTSILLDDLLKIGQRHFEINCIKSSISMLDDILACEIVDQKDLSDLYFGKSINIELKNVIGSQSLTLDKKIIFLSHNGDIVSFGELIGNLFKPIKILL